MEQTAVEWLIDQLEKKGDASVNMSIGRMQISIIEEDYINLLEQAKEMEEQQQGYSEEDIINALHSVELKDNKDYSKIFNGMKEWFEQFKNK